VKQEILWLILTALALLLAGSLRWLRQRRRRITQGGKPLDIECVVRDRIEGDHGIRRLYTELSFEPWLEWKLEAHLNLLEELIVTTIPKFGQFRKAIQSLEARFSDSFAAQGDPLQTLHGLFKGESGSLVRELIAAGDDRPRVLSLLNRNPVYDPLPFLVDIPFYKEGRLTWRTPVGVSVIRKGPKDTALFTRKLGEIEDLVRTAKIQREPQRKDDVLKAISKLQRDLGSPTAYFPTSLRTLGGCLRNWQRDVPTFDKRKQLDHFLGKLVTIEHKFDVAETKEIARSGDGLSLAQCYLEGPWMQSPRVTNKVIALLLRVEQARCKGLATHRVLRTVLAEIVVDAHDPGESMRRLRQLEERGHFVNSLIYSLLHLVTDDRVKHRSQL
jgi:hypothetical protein